MKLTAAERVLWVVWGSLVVLWLVVLFVVVGVHERDLLEVHHRLLVLEGQAHEATMEGVR